VEKAYNGLGGNFRERVPLADFAAMFHRMTDPDADGQLPGIRQASVTDATGPEHPVARFRVEYLNGGAKAEYHFARIDGLWQLQSFTRVPSELEGPLKRAGPPHALEGGKGASPTKAVEGATTQPPAPAGGRPATPCDYVIQPGDTLGGISAQFYGTARHWRRILEANPGLTERSLRVGRKIRIPSNPEPPPPRDDAADAPKAAPTIP
jgi:LysM repeat protein